MFEWVGDDDDPEYEHVSQPVFDDMLVFDVDNESAWVKSDTFIEVRQ